MRSRRIALQPLRMVTPAAGRANRCGSHTTGSSSGLLIGWLAVLRGRAALEVWLCRGGGVFSLLLERGSVRGCGYRHPQC